MRKMLQFTMKIKRRIFVTFLSLIIGTTLEFVVSARAREKSNIKFNSISAYLLGLMRIESSFLLASEEGLTNDADGGGEESCTDTLDKYSARASLTVSLSAVLDIGIIVIYITKDSDNGRFTFDSDKHNYITQTT